MLILENKGERLAPGLQSNGSIHVGFQNLITGENGFGVSVY